MASFQYVNGETWTDVPNLAYPEDESGSIRVVYPEATSRDGNGAPCGIIGAPRIEIKSGTMTGTGWLFWQNFFADETVETADISLTAFNDRVGEWLQYSGVLLRPRCESVRPGGNALQTEYRDVSLVVIEAEEYGGVAPTITSNPADATQLEGETADFYVEAAGTPTPTLQWQVDAGAGYVDVTSGTGANTNHYTTDTLTLADDGNVYRCRASNSLGVAYSTGAGLTVGVVPVGLQPYATAFYPFSGTGDSAAIGADAGPNGYDLTSSAYPDAVTGPDTATAADFDGAAEFLKLAAQSFNTDQSVSVLFWFKTPSTWPTIKRILDCVGTGNGGLRIVTTASTGYIEAQFYSGGSGTNVGAVQKASLVANTWQACAVSVKVTGTTVALRIYAAAWNASAFTASGANPVSVTMTDAIQNDSSTPHIGASIAEDTFTPITLKNMLVVAGALDAGALDDILALGPDFTFAELAGVTPGWE